MYLYLNTLAFLDYIWYSLDYTGNARLYRGFTRLYRGQASTILGDYESLYRDLLKDYIGIMAQMMEMRSDQTHCDCLQIPQLLTNIDIHE